MALIAIFALSLVQAHPRGLRGFILGRDFRAYYTAGLMAAHGVRSEFYDLETQYRWQQAFAPEVDRLEELMPFLNPPFIAAVLVPLAQLPLERAYFAWGALNLALLAVTCTLFVRSLAPTQEGTKLTALILVLIFIPLWWVLLHGQISLVPVLALTVAWQAFRAGKDLRAGLWTSLLLLKPQLILVPALLIVWKRRGRAFLGMALGSGALLIISLLLIGWRGIARYTALLGSTSQWGDAFTIHPQRMHTWRGFLHLLLNTDNAAEVWPWWLLGVAMALALLLWSWRGRWDASSPQFDLQWAQLVLTALFVSPHANFHELTLLLVPGVLLARAFSMRRWTSTERWALTCVPFLGVAIAWLAPFSTAVAGIQPTVLFMALTLVVLAWTQERTKRSANDGDDPPATRVHPPQPEGSLSPPA